jgi:hypothetical protein
MSRSPVDQLCGLVGSMDISTSPSSSLHETQIVVDVRKIGFSQSTIKPSFKNGTSVEDCINGIRKGTVSIREFPLIRVVWVNNQYISLDNRRLFVFKSSLSYKRDQNIKVVLCLPTDPHPNQRRHPGETIADELARKMTTSDPSHIHVKDGIVNWEPRVGPRGGWYVYDKHHRKVYLSTLSSERWNDLKALKPGTSRVKSTVRMGIQPASHGKGEPSIAFPASKAGS